MNVNHDNYYDKDSLAFKEMARRSLRENWPSALFVMAVTTLLGTLLGPNTHWIVDIALFLFSGALMLSSVHYFLRLHRNERAEISDLLYGFNQLISATLTYLLFLLFILLWTLLLIIPGIIAGLRYAMTFYILNDEPDIKPHQAIKRSSEMMNGQKWNFFKLQLSFFGWYLLGIIAGLITVAALPFVQMNDPYWSGLIIALFTLPVLTYTAAGSAAFYENLKAIQQGKQV
ncbi:DUF975 family protein [Paenibacillus qinlingensis]|uniref:Membrane protein n=1 Tax=Paenibacillus qinlingensis TaxID=1837343 RepID=A0ABU1NXP5_9BACL|nr:DUF975 family protein [Paenibacillus qinlingensis]MDR6551841.1 putative membrane protein [Paenibacillus qinlingensis]